MFKNLTLERPLAVFDLETTGTDVKNDRIVEISVLKIFPDGSREQRTRRLNPTIPIPKEASDVHGITDADVATCPTFREIAQGLLKFLDGCDLCGFNIKRFDLRLLCNEFMRAGLALPLDRRAIIDPLEIFHTFERRDLSAAVRFYCGRELAGAHQAEADVLATVDVLDAQVATYAELPKTVAGLHQHFKDPNSLDSNNFFTKVGNEVRFAMGKYRGQPLDFIAQTKPDYLEWMLGADFFEDTKRIAREALERARASAPVVVGRIEPPAGERPKPVLFGAT